MHAGIELEIIFLLMVITSVAMGIRYFKLPYTIALIFAGIILSFFDIFPDIRLTPQLIFHVLLPPLLFEAAFNLNFTELKENIKPVLIYAVIGVVIAVFTTGFIISYGLNNLLGTIHIPLIACFLFGAVISSTDPISVLAIFKELGVPKRLSLIVDGESLFNDGVSVVVYGIISAIAVGTSEFSMVHSIKEFVAVAFGGALIGTILGLTFSKITALVDDHLIEITLTTILAYLSFIAAEHFEVSGVISVICAGLMVGNYGSKIGMSPTTRVSVKDFWEYIAFIVNSVVFFIIGLEVNSAHLMKYLPYIFLAIIAVLLGRIVAISILSPFINKIDKKISFKWQAVMVWGGIRGALAMALALAIPKSYPYREFILVMTFGVVAFSLIVQGLSIKSLLSFLKVGGRDKKLDEYEYEKGKFIAYNDYFKELIKMFEDGLISKKVYDLLLEDVKNGLKTAQERIEELAKDDNVSSYEYSSSLKRLLLKEKDAVNDAMKSGIISSVAAEKLITEINNRLIELA
jgi:CPA1 family monovalent cation:H+ antiporter